MKWAPEVTGRFNRMRANFISAVNAKPSRLLEMGARARSGNTRRDWLADHVNYVGSDISPGPNVDVVADAHKLSQVFKDKFDFVISFSTFEHILMPLVVAIEINKILTPGGLVFTYTHQSWPVHEEPWDFWRFVVNGWKGIFNKHTGFEIVDAQFGEPAFLTALDPNSVTREIHKHPFCYLASGCIARKVGDPIVKWEADVSEITDLNYSHGVEIKKSATDAFRFSDVLSIENEQLI